MTLPQEDELMKEIAFLFIYKLNVNYIQEKNILNA